MCVCERQYTSELGGSGVLMSDSCDESSRSKNDFDRNTVYPKNLTNTETGALIIARTIFTRRFVNPHRGIWIIQTNFVYKLE